MTKPIIRDHRTGADTFEKCNYWFTPWATRIALALIAIGVALTGISFSFGAWWALIGLVVIAGVGFLPVWPDRKPTIVTRRH